MGPRIGLYLYEARAVNESAITATRDQVETVDHLIDSVESETTLPSVSGPVWPCPIWIMCSQYCLALWSTPPLSCVFRCSISPLSIVCHLHAFVLNEALRELERQRLLGELASHRDDSVCVLLVRQVPVWGHTNRNNIPCQRPSHQAPIGSVSDLRIPLFHLRALTSRLSISS